jgi:hypothetical protein
MTKKDQDNLARLYVESGWRDADGARYSDAELDEGDYAENSPQPGSQMGGNVEIKVLDEVLNSIQYWKKTGKGLNGVIADMEVALMNLKRN